MREHDSEVSRSREITTRESSKFNLKICNLQVICWWYGLRGPSSRNSAHRELSQ